MCYHLGRMSFFRELLLHLRAGFSSTWSFLLACVLLAVLDIATLVGLIWYVFFRERLPLTSEALTLFAGGYLICVALLLVLATGFGRLMSIRMTALFYGSIGLFFFVHGMLGQSGRDFATWPWVIVCLLSLGVVVTQLARELSSGQNETPHE